MANMARAGSDTLSSWWNIAAAVTMVFGFAVLILITVKAYENAPPIPATVVDPAGAVLFTSDDVAAGQQVFLKHGLMNNGTIWGHGGYLGPDFSAQYLHNWALDAAEHSAQARFGRPYAELAPPRIRPASTAWSPRRCGRTTIDAATGKLALDPAGAEFLQPSDLLLAGLFCPSGREWRTHCPGDIRSAGVAAAHGLLRLDSLGLGRRAARHVTFLHQQLPLRSAGRQHADIRSPDL